MKKLCSICKIDKKLEEFNKNKAKKDGLNTICRICSNNSSRLYYSLNREHHKNVIRDRTKKNIILVRDLMIDYLKAHPCIDCGESDIVVLQFDHRDSKRFNISNAVHSGTSWKIVKQEIDKCDVRCANCHTRKTAKEQNWYKQKI